MIEKKLAAKWERNSDFEWFAFCQLNTRSLFLARPKVRKQSEEQEIHTFEVLILMMQ